MEKIALSEGSEGFKAIKKEWQEKAKAATIETLPALLSELTEKYQHDYGTICHAVAIAAIAAAWAVDHSPTGGITGFQEGAIMWEFIREWNCSSNKTGLRLVDYDNFLYPQYADKFQKVLGKDTWQAIQKEAQRKIEEANKGYGNYLEALKQYKEDIAAFIAKYPDYNDRREHYDPIGMGTGEQWEAEKKKKDSGFEFAPQEPYCPVNNTNTVYQHWKSICNGQVPFGYVVDSEG
jgi:hypothetical protein